MLSPRELATVLAALRHWQQAAACHGDELAEMYPQLTNERPLDQAEIDHLCERLNGYEPCGCETPGYFCCGVPGVLAHLKSGRVPPGAKVERCDQCQRLPSDKAARQKLRELGLL